MVSLAQEDIEYIKSQFEDWVVELIPESKPGVYDLELRNRMLKVEQELKHQRELMQQGFALMDKRLEQVDKRFEQVDKRFEQVDKRFETMQQSMDKRFELMQQSMGERFEAMQQSMDKRFEAIQQSMDERFAQVDKRFEVLTNRIDIFMRWSFGLTLTVGGIIIGVLKFT